MPTLDEHAQAGLAAVNDNRLDDAIVEFEAAVALDDSRPDLNNLLGMAYIHRGQAADGLPYLERAVELARAFNGPEHQELRRNFHLGLAAAYAKCDRFHSSRATLEEVVATWPGELRPRLTLGNLLLQHCELDAGLAVFRAISDSDDFDEELKSAADAIVGAVRAFEQEDGLSPDIFLRAHAESYGEYFDGVVAEQVEEGWLAEAARMVRGADGEPKPMLVEGAREYAMQRVDLVNPENGEVAEVYSEREPMIVEVNGLEPLAHVPAMLPWAGHPFPVWICTRAPWHWLPLTVQFQQGGDDVIDRIDPTIGDWYLSGFNGDFGERDKGRFHYVSDPTRIFDDAVIYTFDLGRARYDAIPALMSRLLVLHDRHPIARVLIGQGALSDPQ
jgi:tetratricopeptide (TPR) repeat protein